MKEVLILEDKSETRKVLAGLVKEVRSDAVIYEAADEKTAYDIAMKRTIDLFLVDIILHPQQHDDVSGGEFAQNIRKVDKYLFTPILIITSIMIRKCVCIRLFTVTNLSKNRLILKK